jgi:superfamily I DNA/RNA helicase
VISLSGLNQPQRQAAEAVEGPVLILAGAGSGKTRTLTYRMGHMVANLGISPKEILGVTFTNKAAKEMRERVVSLLGRPKSKGITLSTFHSLGVKILKGDIEKLGYHKNFSIYDQSDQVAIVREALRHYMADKKFDQKTILSRIGYLKNLGIREEDFAQSPYFNGEDPYELATEFVYRYYQDKLKFYNAIDFDDILFLVIKLFKENPDVAKKYSERFRYIMVDEYQDTNGLQFQLILGLTSTHNNLCVVGDDDQSIYAFRGADVQNILSFDRNFPGAKVVKLEQNYRSVAPIIKLANEVIKDNKNRMDKTLWSDRPSDDLPLLWAMGDSDHEAQVIVEDIVQYQGRGGFLGEVAILYRSNTQVPPFEDELRLSNVPYTIFGGQKLYEKKEVKDLISYLCTILNPNDQMAIRRILNVPNRGIGNATLEKYVNLSLEKNISLFDVLESTPDLDPKREENIKSFVRLIRRYQERFAAMPLPEAITSLIDEINFHQFIEKSHDNPKQAERRKNDVHAFINSADRFVRYHKNHANLKTFVERLLLQDAQDGDDANDEDDDVRKNQVTLMTLHSSKGLEFDQVYLVGMEEELLPHKKTIAEGADLSEERRLCYVGITRAREKLVMSYCKERELYGKQVQRHSSRFINEHKDLYLEQDRTNFGHLTKEEADVYKKNFFSDLLNSIK